MQLIYLTEEAGIQGDVLNAERLHPQQCERTRVLLEALHHPTLYLHSFTKIKPFCPIYPNDCISVMKQTRQNGLK